MPSHCSTKDIILKTAQTLFAQNGFEGISVDKIAKEANVNKALIYYYFSSKDDLYKRSFVNTIKRFEKAISEKIFYPKTDGPTLTAYVNNFIDFMVHNNDISLYLLREMIHIETNSSSVAEELTELFNLVYHDVLRVVNKARKQKEVSYPNIDFYASYIMNVCLFGSIMLHFGSLNNFQITLENYSDYFIFNSPNSP